ncbi:MAG: hypothetical protein AAF713_19070 [Pseudomonadota bacterium]
MSRPAMAAAQSFTGADLLKLAELARTAYARSGVLRRELTQEPDGPPLLDHDDAPAEDPQEQSAPSRAFARQSRVHDRSGRAPR